MKNIISFIFLFCLCFTNIDAQSLNHVSLDGLEISGGIDSFIEQLKNKGFTFDSINTQKGSAYFHGSLLKGKLPVAILDASFSIKTKTVYEVTYATPLLPRKNLVKIWNKIIDDVDKNKIKHDYISVSSNEYKVNYFDNNGNFIGLINGRFFDRQDSVSFYRIFVDWKGMLNNRKELAERDVFPYPTDNSHLNFMGVNLNDSLFGVCEKLKAKGFNSNDMYGKLRGMPMEHLRINQWGINHNDTAHLTLHRLENSQLVYLIDVILPCRSNDIANTYLKNYKQILDDKFGVSNKKQGAYSYKVLNNLGECIGVISLKANKYNSLELNYNDLINTQLYIAESDSIQKSIRRRVAEAERKRAEEINSDGNFHFMVNSDGSFNIIDNSPYYVIKRGNKRAHQIYKELLSNAAKLYVNPQKVISGIQDQFIVINGMFPNFYTVSPDNHNISSQYGMLYHLEIEIKDYKIKINKPSITYFTQEWLSNGISPLDYDQMEPHKCLPLVAGDIEFKDRINNIINSTLFDIVYGSTNDNW